MGLAGVALSGNREVCGRCWKPRAAVPVLTVVDQLFEWNTEKDTANRRKHGVSFDEATTAFQDLRAIVFDDPDHSSDEHREVLVGYSDRRLLVVSFTIRDGRVRLISARRATPQERHIHEEEVRETEGFRDEG